MLNGKCSRRGLPSGLKYTPPQIRQEWNRQHLEREAGVGVENAFVKTVPPHPPRLRGCCESDRPTLETLYMCGRPTGTEFKETRRVVDEYKNVMWDRHVLRGPFTSVPLPICHPQRKSEEGTEIKFPPGPWNLLPYKKKVFGGRKGVAFCQTFDKLGGVVKLSHRSTFIDRRRLKTPPLLPGTDHLCMQTDNFSWLITDETEYEEAEAQTVLVPDLYDFNNLRNTNPKGVCQSTQLGLGMMTYNFFMETRPAILSFVRAVQEHSFLELNEEEELKELRLEQEEFEKLRTPLLGNILKLKRHSEASQKEHLRQAMVNGEIEESLERLWKYNSLTEEPQQIEEDYEDLSNNFEKSFCENWLNPRVQQILGTSCTSGALLNNLLSDAAEYREFQEARDLVEIFGFNPWNRIVKSAGSDILEYLRSAPENKKDDMDSYSNSGTHGSSSGGNLSDD